MNKLIAYVIIVVTYLQINLLLSQIIYEQFQLFSQLDGIDRHVWGLYFIDIMNVNKWMCIGFTKR